MYTLSLMHLYQIKWKSVIMYVSKVGHKSDRVPKLAVIQWSLRMHKFHLILQFQIIQWFESTLRTQYSLKYFFKKNQIVSGWFIYWNIQTLNSTKPKNAQTRNFPCLAHSFYVKIKTNINVKVKVLHFICPSPFEPVKIVWSFLCVIF